ncbi:LacI family DNA-binding transcriptional regulator [Actinomadura sp. 7K507]|uniref:LacI family DNA-binding transcriptional regulator n=1 Tax=Actinomadura sp. 7K507 TaxID=2530365 RepID=UPI0010465BCD|nr:LacI family DNA-binding transcriptional regulator [Actinomadura sp. 7K507]TDC84936.1 LacI family transcriptional regulator [Actinomadura sp. 7K507]
MATRDRRRRVTIADVADHAQVSTTAVSKVIRNAYGVSPAMRERVKAAIAELGYRPHAAARAMRGRTFTIGLMLPHIRNPFFADILDGLMEQLADTDYQSIMIQGGATQKTERRAVEALVDRQVDGIIMVGPLASRTRLEEVSREMPIVVLGRHERSAAYDAVFDDDDAGAELVVQHLITLGHRRIVHITHQDESIARPADLLHKIRAEAYERVMREHGLAGEIAVATTYYTEEGGYEGARELLGRSPRPTAIFAGADQAAFGALAAVHEAGLSVPTDISIAGYDNTRLAALPNISLTSIDQDGTFMGRTAGRLLLERIEGRTSAVRFSVTPSLIHRRSTAPPNGPRPESTPLEQAAPEHGEKGPPAGARS